MLKKDVKIGSHYAMRHHNEHNLTVVRIESLSAYGGYNARKLKTNRTIRVKSAAKLRFEVFLNPEYPHDSKQKWITEKRDPKNAKLPCDGCPGNGVYHGSGYVENGKFRGFTGTCFRCEGKGFQNEADRKRNWGYDNFHRKVT
jgi:hypothetical protein